MNKQIRVRYAPSPTGYPHVGNIRAALFNWLFARHHGGSFLVRIEDTDRTRYVEGAVDAILDGLRWLGLNWDEGPIKGGDYGPYFQSERLGKYQAAAEKLIADGFAYRCICSSERLEELRAAQTAAKLPPGYDRHCRDRETITGEGLKSVVRFKVPLSGNTTFNDLIRGEVTFDNSLLDDFVLLKSDGFPTYHLANIVDDHEMKISHVIRGEEWLSSAPRHVMLYRALGYEPPLFAHLPMILGTDRSKLSKRHGAVSIIDYKEQGYLPETMLNFLTLLGWSLDDKTELMTIGQIIENFSIDRVSKTAAIFNVEKLDWMNGVYIRDLSLDEFTDRATPFLTSGIPEAGDFDRVYVKNALALVQERVKKLGELRDQPELTRFFFTDELAYLPADLIGKKMTAAPTLAALETSLARIEAMPEFTIDAMEISLRSLAEELELKPGQLFGSLRVAVTGQNVSPPLFETMAVLGRERTTKRLHAAVAKVRQLLEQAGL
ncbi:MAG: glutamate--tRNA ligase [Dehalogenimonas sp.]|uniref:Glutamate--tRNA ligase n=1 Tax=Candidatus Dehalogenimonas loeffleri TaxID=3127115 RepID=A0ABZ2J1A6_9CHLR|nr:glutamate--tRNA ligase [Dehalogenimonas sp.]